LIGVEAGRLLGD